ncbi:MAG: hypothetical protein QOE70_2493 [Chthoniobacter sp.]|jgi:hypothetical protein|nr:hypothetical protein [Chthoniobacter sp.]
MTTATAPRTNTFFTQDLCPLCHDALAADVATHLAREEEGFGTPAFAIIKELHPDWLEEHGACVSCWSFYSNLVHVLNVSGSFDARFQIKGRKDALTRELH